MRTIIAVGLAGSLGTLARYGLEGLVSNKTAGSFPWGTFVVNITGCVVLGVLFAVFIEGRMLVAPWLRTALTVGLVGSYTTFSTLNLETFRLFEDGSHGLAAANALGSLVVGLLALYLGIILGRLI